MKAFESERSFLSTTFMVCLLVALIALLIVASLLIGPAHLSVYQALDGLIRGTGVEGIVIRDIRLPRMLLSLFVGAMLGMSGSAMQGLLRNPLAEPSVFGAPQAAAFGAVCVLYSGLADAHSFVLPVAAIAGAFISVGLILLVAGRNAGLLTLLLTGLAVASLAGAATSLALNLSPNPFAVAEIVFWLMGSFEDRSMQHVLLALPFIIVALIVLARCGGGYRAMTLGDDTALTMGVNVRRIQFVTVAAVALGVGAGVAVSGAIGFVGLAAPHLMRSMIGSDPQRILLPSALTGAALLTAADILVRLVPANTEIKVGVLTAMLGVPLFLWLVLSRRAFVQGDDT